MTIGNNLEVISGKEGSISSPIFEGGVPNIDLGRQESTERRIHRLYCTRKNQKRNESCAYRCIPLCVCVMCVSDVCEHTHLQYVLE